MGLNVRQGGAPCLVEAPETIDALAAALARAAHRGQTVRPIGAGRSLSPILATEGVAVRTDRLARMPALHRGIRDSADPEGLVAVEAGVRVRTLARALARRGRALQNTAAFTDQTVAGAVGTASHGTGLALPPMCDQVESVLLVTAEGRRLRLEPRSGPTDPALHDEPGVELVVDDGLFYAAVTGLGALGVVAALTLRTQPTCPLREHRAFLPLDEALDERCTTEHLERTRHLQVLFNPAPGRGGRRWCCVTERVPVPRVRLLDRLRPRQRIAPTIASHLPIERPLLAWLARHRGQIGAAVDASLRSTARRPLTGRMDRLLDNWPLNSCAEAYAIEAFVPLADWRAAVDDLLALAARRAAMPLVGPVSLRFVAASDHLLAPSFGQSGAMIEVVHLVGAPGARRALEPYAEQLAAYGGRLHFGLDVLGLRGPDDLRRRYPELPRWLAARDRLDPEGRFTSPFLRTLGLGPEA